MWRRFPSIAFFLAFLFLVGTQSEAQYVRPASDPPTDSDLLTYDGQEKTVIVQIVNATPYDIYLKDTHMEPASTAPPPLTSSSVTAADQEEMLDRDRHSRTSFMFAPTGIPWYIPGTPLEAFHSSDENYRNTFTKPFTMVFSWDDHAGFVNDNWVKWTVKQVEYCVKGETDPVTNEWTCDDTRHGDVDLGLWMYRIKPPDGDPHKVDSVFFPSFIHDFLAETLALTGLIMDPVNPIGWLAAIQATKDLAVGVPEFGRENTEPNPGDKLYLASYVIPADNSFCSVVSQTGQYDCNPALLALRRNTCTSDGVCNQDKAGDAVVSKWEADEAGPCTKDGGCNALSDWNPFAPQAELVVSVHLLRNQPAPACVPDVDDSYSCPLGRLNLFMITIMRPTEFAVSALSGGSTVGSTSSSTSLGATATNSMDEIDDVTAASDDKTDPATAQRRRVRLFLLQAGAGPLRHTLKQEGLSGLLTLRSVVRGYLTLAQRQQLHMMVNHMLAGDRPTFEERELVRHITREFQKQMKQKQAHKKSK